MSTQPASYYQGILADLHATLHALNTEDYQWDPSDRWTQAVAAEGATSHLETWVDMGQMVDFRCHDIDHDAALIVAMRYTADDDALAQARIHAAARHASETLQSWAPSDYDGVGALPTSYSLDHQAAEWVLVSIAFTLTIPRG